jgi:hypothetical protein
MAKEQSSSASFLILPSSMILKSHRMTGSVTRSGNIQDNTDSKLRFSHHFVGYYNPSIGLNFTNSKVQ